MIAGKRCLRNRWSIGLGVQQLLLICSTIFFAAALFGDHLVPLDLSDVAAHGSGAEYRALYELKLFLTPGDVARYVHLPGAIAEPEGVLSLYHLNRGSKGKVGGYRLTWTEPSARLWDCIPTGEEQVTGRRLRDSNSFKVARQDAQLPDATARKVHDAWLSMLKGKAADPCVDCVSDGTTEIFSATDTNGKVLTAQLPVHIGKETGGLLELANSLIKYCQAPESTREQIAREIDQSAERLYREVQR